MTAPHMEAQAFEADEALSEGIKIKWLSSIKDIGESDLTVEHMEMDATASRSPPASSRPCPPTPSCWRSASRPIAAFCGTLAGVAFTADGSVIVGCRP